MSATTSAISCPPMLTVGPKGMTAMTMSVGTALHPRKLQHAIARAHAANIILVAAAGNCVNKLGGNDGYVVFPARNYRCIAAAA